MANILDKIATGIANVIETAEDAVKGVEGAAEDLVNEAKPLIFGEPPPETKNTREPLVRASPAHREFYTKEQAQYDKNHILYSFDFLYTGGAPSQNFDSGLIGLAGHAWAIVFIGFTTVQLGSQVKTSIQIPEPWLGGIEPLYQDTRYVSPGFGVGYLYTFGDSPIISKPGSAGNRANGLLPTLPHGARHITTRPVGHWPYVPASIELLSTCLIGQYDALSMAVWGDIL